jgi:division protein CdvB (Snf7/Vps24/ESCRT-III family)
MKILSYFRRSKKEALREKINRAIRGVDVHRRELDNLRARLETRMKSLYETMLKAKQNKEEAKATVFANELAELKRVVRVVTTSQLALTQIVTRMESMRDVGDAIFQMSSAMQEVGKANKSVSGIIPSFNLVTDEINATFTETMTDLGQVSPNIAINLENDSTSDIIESAQRFAEEKVSELDDVNLVPKLKEQKLMDSAKKVALAATDNEEEEFKPILLSRPRSDAVEAKVEHYYRSNSDKFTVLEAAADLQLPIRDVELAAVSLASKGKITLRDGV